MSAAPLSPVARIALVLVALSVLAGPAVAPLLWAPLWAPLWAQPPDRELPPAEPPEDEAPLGEPFSPPPEAPAELLPVRAEGLLTTRIGAGRLMTLPAEIERVALADEAVARVQIISSREILLSGLAVGRTTLFVWLRDGERRSYAVRVERDLELLRRALRDLDPDVAIRVSEDGGSILLVGEVDDAGTADRAVAVAEELVAVRSVQGPPPEVLSFLRYPPSTTAADLWLTDALHEIDPRIRVRRIQVGSGPQPELDSYILEGRVRTVQDLMQAVILAERQLGGTGVLVEAPARDLTFQRNQGFTGLGTGQGPSPLTRPPSGLAAQVARGLVITSESGRVLSLLEVDELPQIMVSIRAYQIDRAKARRQGIDWRFDSEHLSLGSFTGPQGQGLPGFFGGAGPDVGQIPSGNLVGAFVDQTFAIATAIDFLEDRDLARSVAEPNILTLSGEEATILIGGEVPVPTTTVGEVAAVQGFFFQSFGVQLNLRPTLDDHGVVSLEVSPSIIRPAPGLGVGQVPGFQIQSVQTTARVPAGRSLILGGLITFDESFEEARVPFLGKIPLFRWWRRNRSEQELLFIITPRVVRMPGPAMEAVDVPQQEDLRLPEMEIPEDRDDWKDEVEAPTLPPNGVPVEFLRLRPAENGESGSGVETPAGAQGTRSGSPFETGPETGPEIGPGAEPGAEHGVEPAPPASPWEPGTILAVSPDAMPCLNLRPHPSFLVDPFDCLPPGTRVELVGRVEGWSRVSISSGSSSGRVGWMLSDHLAPAGEPSTDPPEPDP